MSETLFLDTLEEMKKIDKSGMLDICLKLPEHCRNAIKRAKETQLPNRVKISKKTTIEYKFPKNIIIVGVGGSAIGGEILRDWLRNRIHIPLEVCKGYSLPAYANKDTLVFAVSYSGNTEETISAFLDAVKRGCMTITITSGGHLLSFSKKLRVPHVLVPKDMPPRTAIPFLFFPLPVLMERMSISSNIEDESKEVLKVLKKLRQEIDPKTPTSVNISKKLAFELKDTIPVVYGFRQYKSIAYRLKTQFNENSKIPSTYDVFPELNHNEVMGWEAPEYVTKRFSVIILRDGEEPKEIIHKIEATKLLALYKAQKVLEINSIGKKKLAKMFSLLHIGDLTSVYLAILLKKDPAPTGMIDDIKIELSNKFPIMGRLKEIFLGMR
jgi:glucose/mannose-6-phosphate isomerase